MVVDILGRAMERLGRTTFGFALARIESMMLVALALVVFLVVGTKTVEFVGLELALADMMIAVLAALALGLAGMMLAVLVVLFVELLVVGTMIAVLVVFLVVDKTIVEPVVLELALADTMLVVLAILVVDKTIVAVLVALELGLVGTMIVESVVLVPADRMMIHWLVV